VNFANVTDELIARGSDGSGREGGWINLAYRRILNAYEWPFTEGTATGTAGAGFVQVADLKKVRFVGDIGQATAAPGYPLSKITVDELAEEYKITSLTETGVPAFWWLDNSASPTPVIRAYPVGGTLHVRYQKRIDPLTGTNSPVFDEEYHLLIVDRAMVEVYKDGEEWAAAKEALQMFAVDLGAMAQDYQVYARQGGYIEVPDPTDG